LIEPPIAPLQLWEEVVLRKFIIGRRRLFFEVLAQQTAGNLPKLKVAAEVDQRQRYLLRIDFQKRLGRDP
jgi:hypothetical protein